ncbi:MAG: 6-carboxytetrahydropterin synthase QueD [Thermoplasmata archaeon M11B2D]|nr:MAG: 6-carboxytetrahydropterin synthase QueD [Thermoplasmata archaeon M11B2D]PNX54169.1 MAG: 6-carboxytetrahydropterin synthase QueD [Thermoplasmata archaeon M9B2D]
MRLCREFYFDAAHYIPKYKGKCENLHGHTYKLEVVIEGGIQEDGMVVDFVQMKEIVETAVIEKLDHQSLNERFDNPTAEHILEWISTQLKGKLPLFSLRLWEGQGKWVEIHL